MNADPHAVRSLPSASIVVCTRDRPDELARCLPGLRQYASDDHEVIIVDNCPSDNRTEQLLVSYPEFRYVREPRAGLDVARNCGLRVARGEIVAFTDDDAQVDPGWLQALLRNMDDPMVAVVTGLTLPLELETEAQQCFEGTNGFSRGFVRREFDIGNHNPLASGQVGAGVNMAIRRSAIEEVGWFDEALDGGTLTRSGGDQEFFYRVLCRGYRIVYEPRALVWHQHRREWDALRRTVYGYGVGVFAWWTRALLVEREWAVLKWGPAWFWQYHTRNLVEALFRRPDHVPLDLAWAEFRGAIAGPGSYLRARRQAAQASKTAGDQEPVLETSEAAALAPEARSELTPHLS
jgi:glycosyltransferase involved in cell wall biosynthesis